MGVHFFRQKTRAQTPYLLFSTGFHCPPCPSLRPVLQAPITLFSRVLRDSIGHYVGRSVGQLVGWSVGWSVGQSVGQSVGRLVPSLLSLSIYGFSLSKTRHATSAVYPALFFPPFLSVESFLVFFYVYNATAILLVEPFGS